MDAKELLMRMYEARGFSKKIAEKYAENFTKYLKEKGYVAVRIVKVDKETLRSFKFPQFVWGGSMEDILRKLKRACNVGDFVIIEGKAYRRVRGGFRPCTPDDEAELIGSIMTES